MHSSADILKTTELYVLKGWSWWCMNWISNKAVNKINLNKINFTYLEVFVSVWFFLIFQCGCQTQLKWPSTAQYNVAARKKFTLFGSYYISVGQHCSRELTGEGDTLIFWVLILSSLFVWHSVFPNLPAYCKYHHTLQPTETLRSVILKPKIPFSPVLSSSTMSLYYSVQTMWSNEIRSLYKNVKSTRTLSTFPGFLEKKWLILGLGQKYKW